MNPNEESVVRVKIIKIKDSSSKEEEYMLMEDTIGRGKSGAVYKAIHTQSHEKVFAVKVMKLETAKIRKECLDELLIIQNLPRSLNLVQVHPQHLESDNNFYIFLEYCDGGTLEDQNMKNYRKTCEEDEAYNIFLQLTNGLIDLIAGKIDHEDIKPQNVLIKNGIYKFADFGISKLAEQSEGTEIRRGTLIYMPPEKLKPGLFLPNPKTEIFSLGITLYQSIFGSHPYLQKSPTDYKNYLKMIQEAQLPSVESLKRKFPSHSLSIDKLIRIIFKMIELNETKRLSLEELIDYVRTSEPFISMKISESNPKPVKKENKKTRYERIAVSNVMLKESGCLTGITIGVHLSVSERKIHFEMFKTIHELFKDMSSHMQQGIEYLRESKINQLNSVELESSLHLNKTTKVDQLEFAFLLFIDRIFNVLDELLNNYIFSTDMNEEEWDLDIGSDKAFISNELHKFEDRILHDNEKLVNKNEKERKEEIRMVHYSLKEKENGICILLITEFENITDNISFVRVNFKEDILATIFIKEFSSVMKFIKLLVDEMLQQKIQSLLELISLAECNKTKGILSDFSCAGTAKIKELGMMLTDKMSGHEFLEDIESNSDEFEVLDLADFE